MTRVRRAHAVAVVTIALAVAGCAAEDPAAGPDPDHGLSIGPTTASSDQIAALRAAAQLAPCPSAASEPTAAADLPELELACLGGGPDVSVAGLVGTPYVMNFWASDCAPCKEEGPYLQEVFATADGAVGVLGVNFLDPGGDGGALAGAHEFGMRFPILFDPDGLLGQTFQVPGLPSTFFVDATGVIVGQHIGAFDSADDLRAAIRVELGVEL
jgi:cytochrome c biogenesis protein CcmG/thiol:disulfide interchange protein DsbE